MTVTKNLVSLLSRPISDLDRERANLLFLDWTGCAVAGQSEPAGQKITNAFLEESGRCTRIGSSDASPLMAALHNGCLGNVLEMDDVDRRAVLHAAPTIIPAALAMAEHRGASKRDFLDAIVVGYEATIRIGRAVGAGHYSYWHNTATCGPFGAAAAACHLLAGSEMVSALGLAGTQAAGLWQTRHEPDSMAKQLHAGHAAHAGVLAAILSAQGFQGPRSILEGEQGFFKAMCRGGDPVDVLVDPDAGWLLHETSLKPYPACRHAHPAIDAVLKAREVSVWKDGTEIIVETYDDALKFCDQPDPQTSLAAKFSLQHSCAVALVRGAPSLSDFDEAAIHDDVIKHARAHVQVRATQTHNDDYPNHYSASVTLNGRKTRAAHAYGDPENPMSKDAAIEKAKSLLVYAGLTEEAAVGLTRAALMVDLKSYREFL